ncbi:ATP-binding cassette domain-containing protein [Candidatus Aminicenantes bacterium AC-335-B20]|jgi:ABC-2 type transport system ATP-binding protein|nr:ATP-binding cassette domain-containing protein [SCandidatus Aminicenantes bacterium Aminicenantia_JdfR_composite]MCP2596437.1 ATP-binding cassette domain-containing protein [Candidatus Aminicenantes bacterium AC-335-G13]MCP2598830.1 ATP-binding cassette domain-containing protein [Candidatus Aminicenantes bacterium AC-335-B20]
MLALQIKNISKKFNGFYAVKNFSLSVPEGTIYGILGPNGAGKTTTIRMIMNILVPDEGEILIFNKRMDDALKNRIGYLPEERGLYRKMKVFEVLSYFGELKGMSRKEISKKIDEWLSRIELIEWKNRKIEELSKGMQQKIQFISTILHSPDLIIFDEPFAGLDPINTNLLKDIMLELKKQGKTILYSTHLMEHAEKLSDYVALINKGEKVLDGKLSEIKAKFGKNLVLEFEGDNGFLKEIKGIKRIYNFGRYVELELKKETNPQDVLKEVVNKVKLIKFEVAEPSLNDIFIRVVGEEKNEIRKNH